MASILSRPQCVNINYGKDKSFKMHEEYQVEYNIQQMKPDMFNSLNTGRLQTLRRDDLFFSTISPLWYGGFQISKAVLTKTYLSFKPTLYGFIPLACFFAVHISSRHWWYRLMLWFKVKLTEVHATEVSRLFQSNYMKLYYHCYIFIFTNQWKCLLWSH